MCVADDWENDSNTDSSLDDFVNVAFDVVLVLLPDALIVVATDATSKAIEVADKYITL